MSLLYGCVGWAFDGAWSGFEVSHADDKNKDVMLRPGGGPGSQMGHPAG